ncbi:MAG TPA: hypothetical protein VI727_03500, partial [Candidatus Brocadiaceae bacterium]|nr:hypothetical protein [Candidatus Brocadiaceae bacterium]
KFIGGFPVPARSGYDAYYRLWQHPVLFLRVVPAPNVAVQSARLNRRKTGGRLNRRKVGTRCAVSLHEPAMAPTHSVYAAIKASAGLKPLASYLTAISKGTTKSSSILARYCD